MLRKTATPAAAVDALVLHRQATVIDTRGMPANQFVTMSQTRGEQPAPTRPLAEAFAEDAALLGIEPMAGRGLGPLRRSARRAGRLAVLVAAATAAIGMVSAYQLVRLLAGH